MSMTDAQVEAALNVFGAMHDDDGLTRAKVRAALDAAEREAWRPIEEAPRDGTRFLAATYCDGLAAATGWRFAVTWWDDQFEQTGWDDKNDCPTYRGAWMAGFVSSWGLEEYREERPTHFQLLRSPPEAGE